MNKRNAHRILCAALVAVLCLTAPAAAVASEYAKVRGGGLNLRQTASLDAKVLGQYGTGTWVEVIKKGETWSKVKVNCKEGYMMTKYLDFGQKSNVMYVRTNTGIGLNLREAPSLCAKIITSFPVNTAVNVIQGGDWAKVKVGDLIGYMSSAYLSSKQAATGGSTVKPTCSAVLKNINGGCYVNFRKAPGMKTKIIKAYPVGTAVNVLEKGALWSKVEIDGQQGYVSTYMLKF